MTLPLSTAQTHYPIIAAAIEYLRQPQAQCVSNEALAHSLNITPQRLGNALKQWNGSTIAQLSAFIRQRVAPTAFRPSPTENAAGQLHISTCIPPKGIDTLTYGYADSPFGQTILAWTTSGLCHLMFVDDMEAALCELHKRWPGSVFARDNDAAQQWMERVIRPGAAPIPVVLCGTPFQTRVWCALTTTQPAQRLSYGQLAQLLGKAGAQRAVGRAVAQNPIALLIPCHRVILSNGETGNYHWGKSRKAAIQFWEHQRC